ncbi:hypothetical protein AB4Z50_35225 [Paenibacillus sp. 2TAB26]
MYLDAKYDLIFAVEAANESEARLRAEEELRNDGLLDKVDQNFEIN